MTLADDIAELRLIDNHCHRPLAHHAELGLASWRGLVTESDDPSLGDAEVEYTPHFRRLVARLADHLGCPATSDAVSDARRDISSDKLTTRLFDDAGIEQLLFDEGFPRADPVTNDALAGGSFSWRSIIRVETVLDEIAYEAATAAELSDLLDERFADLRAQGFVAVKSAIAYRTGLVLDEWSRPDVDRALAALRREPAGAPRKVRTKPLTDVTLQRVLYHAAQQQLPVQFHTGYGDCEVDLLTANPLQLRALFTDPQYAHVPFVLLHGSFPYVREAAYLASVYGNVHLDVSFAVPNASVGELVDVTRHAFGIAPASRLLYSSDAYSMPDLHWLSAHDGRHCVATVLNEQVHDGDIDRRAAYDHACRFFRGNAEALYELDAQ